MFLYCPFDIVSLILLLLQFQFWQQNLRKASALPSTVSEEIRKLITALPPGICNLHYFAFLWGSDKWLLCRQKANFFVEMKYKNRTNYYAIYMLKWTLNMLSNNQPKKMLTLFMYIFDFQEHRNSKHLTVDCTCQLVCFHVLFY